MKRLGLCLAGILTVAALALGYHHSFAVAGDYSNLKDCVTAWEARGHLDSYQVNISLYDRIELGNRTYVAMELNEQMGYALLKKGLTGRYRIDHISFGDLNIQQGVVEIQGNKYLLFLGRNAYMGIKRAEFQVDANHTYSMDIPDKKIFIVATQVDDSAPLGGVALDGIELYDAQGKDISQQVLTGSAVIQA